MDTSSGTSQESYEHVAVEDIPPNEELEQQQQQQQPSVNSGMDFSDVSVKVEMEVSNGVPESPRTLVPVAVHDDQSSDLLTSDSHDECVPRRHGRSAAVAICGDTADASGETSSSSSAPGDGWIVVPKIKTEPVDEDGIASAVEPSSVSNPELLPHLSELDAAEIPADSGPVKHVTIDLTKPRVASSETGFNMEVTQTNSEGTSVPASNADLPPLTQPTPGGTGGVIVSQPVRREYRDRDWTASATSDSSEDSSDDSSDVDASSSSEAGPAVMKKKIERPRKKLDAVAEDGRAMGEDMPPIEDLQITVGDDVVLEVMGKVASIVGTLVVVQAKCDVPVVKPLDYGTILFTENKTPIGQVFETFGRVEAPMYTIRFNNTDHMNKHGIKVNLPLFYAPNMETFTKYVFTEQLRRERGSDASWENDFEPPDKFVEYSDDEKERMAKRQLKSKKEGREEMMDGDGADDAEKKRRKKRKPLRKKPNANGYTADISDSDGFQGADSSGSGSYFHQGSFNPAPWPPTGRSRWRQPPPHASARPWYNRMPYGTDGSPRERTPWDRQQRPMFRVPSHQPRPSYRQPNPSFKQNRFQQSHPNDFPPSFPPQQGPPWCAGPNPPPDFNNMGGYNPGFNQSGPPPPPGMGDMGPPGPPHQPPQHPNFHQPGPPLPGMGDMGPSGPPHQPPPPQHPNFHQRYPPPPSSLPQPQFGGNPHFPRGPPLQQWGPGGL